MVVVKLQRFEVRQAAEFARDSARQSVVAERKRFQVRQAAEFPRDSARQSVVGEIQRHDPVRVVGDHPVPIRQMPVRLPVCIGLPAVRCVVQRYERRPV